MPGLPRVWGAQTARAPERLGFSKVRQSGSHLVMRLGERGCVVPMHAELKVGTLAGCCVKPRSRRKNSSRRCTEARREDRHRRVCEEHAVALAAPCRHRGRRRTWRADSPGLDNATPTAPASLPHTSMGLADGR
ncbi:MAG: type II toxin-antitoxin system HicA family toxin [Burkholderiales bacterium]|nr:type II toxin-antitoxin system HicA family toxin [Burkholderiales bacterium]